MNKQNRHTSLPIDLRDNVQPHLHTQHQRSGRGRWLIATGLLMGLLLTLVFSIALSQQNQTAQAANDAEQPEYLNAPALQATGTLGAIIGTSVPDDAARATLEAAIQSEIDAAVQATFIALTPTVTPLPTTAPVDTTFLAANPFLGPEDAPITIVEFSDYNCGFCGRFHAQTLEPLLEQYEGYVKFVYREYPIIGGQQSADIGAAAQCVGFQGKYWEFSDRIWANRTSAERPQITGDLITEWANEVEVDFDEFLTCLEEGQGFEIVIADFEAGREYNITGTPTFFINGERLVGAQPLEVFQQVIDRQLRDLGIEPPSAES